MGMLYSCKTTEKPTNNIKFIAWKVKYVDKFHVTLERRRMIKHIYTNNTSEYYIGKIIYLPTH